VPKAPISLVEKKKGVERKRQAGLGLQTSKREVAGGKKKSGAMLSSKERKGERKRLVNENQTRGKIRTQGIHGGKKKPRMGERRKGRNRGRRDNRGAHPILGGNKEGEKGWWELGAWPSNYRSMKRGG